MQFVSWIARIAERLRLGLLPMPDAWHMEIAGLRQTERDYREKGMEYSWTGDAMREAGTHFQSAFGRHLDEYERPDMTALPRPCPKLLDDLLTSIHAAVKGAEYEDELWSDIVCDMRFAMPKGIETQLVESAKAGRMWTLKGVLAHSGMVSDKTLYRFVDDYSEAGVTLVQRRLNSPEYELHQLEQVLSELPNDWEIGRFLVKQDGDESRMSLLTRYVAEYLRSSGESFDDFADDASDGFLEAFQREQS